MSVITDTGAPELPLKSLNFILPNGKMVQDGEIVITDEIMQGELAVLSSIVIYKEPKGQGGLQEEEVVNIESRGKPLVIKPNPLSAASKYLL